MIALALAVLVTACTAVSGDGRGSTLILIGIDGFRWDYLTKTPTPNLDRLVASGVRSERLVPVFPTLTFPNFYSIVTGLYPEHHGIIANTMYDPVLDDAFRLSDRDAVGDGRWWGGEPLWVTAERQGKVTATLFWPGSEAPVAGRRPTYWFPYDDDLASDVKVRQVLSWLDLPDAERPSLITLYFPEVDHANHDHDPETSLEIAAAIGIVDRAIGHLLAGLEARGLVDDVNILVVSDHGIAGRSSDRVIFLDDYVDLATAGVVDWHPVAALRPDAERVEAVYHALADAHPHLRVYRKHEIPERLRYRRHPRITPIVAIADEGWSITTRSYYERRPERFGHGTHGYDHELLSMGATFVAAGPAFREGVTVPPFQNIHLYELMCALLGLDPAPNDGNLDSTRVMLKG